MRWFSHRRSLSPPGGHAMISSVVVCCVRPSYGARHAMHCQWGWLRSFSFFVPADLDLWPLTLNFKLGRDFCTIYLTAKFDRSEVIVRQHTDKQTDTAENTHLASLRYAGGWLQVAFALRFICKHIAHSTCHISRGLGVEKISDSKSNLQDHSRSLVWGRCGVGRFRYRTISVYTLSVHVFSVHPVSVHWKSISVQACSVQKCVVLDKLFEESIFS